MEQFSLAMWLVERKLKGIDPPTTLTPDMIPPRNRSITSSTAVQVRKFIKLSHISTKYCFFVLNVKS